jgi:hypothetical protein
MKGIPGNTLTIEVTGRDGNVPVSSLVRILRDTLAILKDIDAEMAARRQGTLRWEVVEASLNSPLTMTIVGEPLRSDEFSGGVASACLDNLDRLERGVEPHPYFPETAMEMAKHLASVRNDGVSSVVFSSPDRAPFEPTQHLSANVEAILRRRYLFETTTLEGTLEAISVHGKYTFEIYDVLTGFGVKCEFDEGLFDAAVSALRHRVAVTGVAKFNRTGRPMSMKVESMVRLRKPEELPKFREGIDITGGIDSAEYVRRMRDAE